MKEIKVNLLCAAVRAAAMIDESAQVSLSASIYYLEELKQKKWLKVLWNVFNCVNIMMDVLRKVSTTQSQHNTLDEDGRE
jgi:hypothetical protein